LTEALDYLALSLTPEMTPRLARALSLREPIDGVLAHPDEHADLLGAPAREAIANGEAHRRAEQESAEAGRRGVRIVGLDDTLYPPLLREIHDPPPVLYLWGTLVPDEGRRSVAIVGSRQCSPQGRAIAHGLGRDVSAQGVTILSGLARGIDVAAHQGALGGGGRTIAVLGSGLDNVYPGEHGDLAVAIAEHGAVVSEFSFGTPPWKGNFPRRNRIIAGWGPAVVVVEAGVRSGALVTARLALDEGRDVFAVPGHPSQETAAGTNQLIRDGGALVRDARDVLEELGLALPPDARPSSEDDGLLKLLTRDVPFSLEDLQSRSGWPTAQVLSRLTELELTSKVRRVQGALYVRN
jgi:DNA processing protein